MTNASLSRLYWGLDKLLNGMLWTDHDTDTIHHHHTLETSITSIEMVWLHSVTRGQWSSGGVQCNVLPWDTSDLRFEVSEHKTTTRPAI